MLRAQLLFICGLIPMLRAQPLFICGLINCTCGFYNLTIQLIVFKKRK